MYKVRFNLGRGKLYKTWQITDIETGGKINYDPEKYSLFLFNCKLINQRGTAEKINCGANKTVCSWVTCEDFYVEDDSIEALDTSFEIKYNPRVKPHWTDWNEKDVDNKEYHQLFSVKNKLYV